MSVIHTTFIIRLTPLPALSVNEKIRITSLSHSILSKLLFILPLFTLYVKVSKKFLTVVWDYTLDIPFELRNVVLYGRILSARLVLRLFCCVGDAALGIPLCRAIISARFGNKKIQGG